MFNSWFQYIGNTVRAGRWLHGPWYVTPEDFQGGLSVVQAQVQSERTLTPDGVKLWIRFLSTKFIITTLSLATVLIGWLCGRDASQLSIILPGILAAYNLANVWQSLIDQKWGGAPPSADSVPIVETTDGTDNGGSSGNSPLG